MTTEHDIHKELADIKMQLQMYVQGREQEGMYAGRLRVDNLSALVSDQFMNVFAASCAKSKSAASCAAVRC